MYDKAYFQPWVDLANAVVGKATTDYITALKNNDIATIRENEEFFRSWRFELYTNGADGDHWIALCKRRVSYMDKKQLWVLVEQADKWVYKPVKEAPKSGSNT